MKSKRAGKGDFPLIRRPQRQRRLPRAAWTLVTLALWIAYGYLAMSLFEPGLWEGRDPLDWVVRHRGDLTLSWLLALGATAASFLLVAWTELDRLRQRRRPPLRLPDVHASAIAQRLHASRTLQQQLARGKIVHLQLDDAARPVRAETHSLPRVSSRKPRAPRPRKRGQE